MAPTTKFADRKIIYVKHPVPMELKQLLKDSGYRIIDADFAPKGAPVLDPESEDVKGQLKSLAKKAAQQAPAIPELTEEAIEGRPHLFNTVDREILTRLITEGKKYEIRPFEHTDYPDKELFGIFGEDGYMPGLFESEQLAHETLEDLVIEFEPEQPPAATEPAAPGTATEPAPTPAAAGGATPPATELKQDGPTVQAYVEAGYSAKNYPPAGYASKSTAEEIAAAVAAEDDGITVPDNWKELEWHEKVKLAKDITKLDKIEATDGKTVTAVAEEHIQAYLDGKK
jgi:hypothetical protein